MDPLIITIYVLINLNSQTPECLVQHDPKGPPIDTGRKAVLQVSAK